MPVPALLDHLGNIIDPRTIEAVRQTKDNQYPTTHRVPYSGRTKAGVIMTPDNALTISAVWACCRYLTQSIAKLDWRLKSKDENGTKIQSNNPVDWILWKRASPEWSSFQFRETLQSWALRWGNGYAEIERNEAGLPMYLWPLEPWRMQVARDLDTEELFYIYMSPRGGTVELDAMDVFHLRGMGDGPVGISVIAYAAESLGWAKAVQLFGSAFFKQSANPSGVVKMKKGMSPEALAELRVEFMKLYAGPSNSNRTVFLDNEADYQPITVEQEKAQFIETNQFLLDEICRWFGVPPHKIYNLLRSTFTNIEQQSIEVVGDSLAPWAQRFCDEADYKLLGQNRRGLYSEMDFSEILMADMNARMQFYQGLRNVAALNANEIRAREGFNAIPEDEGGNKFTMQSAFTTLDKVGEQPAPGAPGSPPQEPAAPAQPSKKTAYLEGAIDMALSKLKETIGNVGKLASAEPGERPLAIPAAVEENALADA